MAIGPDREVLHCGFGVVEVLKLDRQRPSISGVKVTSLAPAVSDGGWGLPGFINDHFVVEIIASDPERASPLTAANFAVDTGEWQPEVHQFAELPTGVPEGPHVLRFRLFDLAGHPSNVHEEPIVVDLTPPESTRMKVKARARKAVIRTRSQDEVSGVAGTRLQVRRIVKERGEPRTCRYWRQSKAQWERGDCDLSAPLFFFGVGMSGPGSGTSHNSQTRFTLPLKRTPGPASYRVRAYAIDAAGNAEKGFSRGQNEARFKRE